MPKKSIFNFPEPSSKKVITLNTKKIYRTRVNKISKHCGLNTVEQFLAEPQKVIDSIKAIVPEDKSEDPKKVRENTAIRRGFCSALMWIFADVPYENRVPYYEYYLTQKDSYLTPS